MPNSIPPVLVPAQGPARGNAVGRLGLVFAGSAAGAIVLMVVFKPG